MRAAIEEEEAVILFIKSFVNLFLVSFSSPRLDEDPKFSLASFWFFRGSLTAKERKQKTSSGLTL